MSRVGVVLMVVLLATASVGLAQKKKAPATRSVAGEVTSADDKYIVGAVVQLKDTKTKQVRSFYTQEHGHYYFNGLSPDVDYELSATFEGAGSPVKTLTVFDSRKDAIINLKLSPKK
jgi:Carboxypeptidase regulatory-like domain